MVVQLICNSRKDFPVEGEMLRFNGELKQIRKVTLALKLRRKNPLFFVNCVVDV